jgi:glycosyltransferase involved in cell wall biosynthesis
MSRGYADLRVLHLQVEFSTWAQARPWSYAAGLGLEEGLSAAGVQFVTLTTPWLGRAAEVLAGQRFDQVWIEVVHQSAAPDALFEWIAGLAPVRVGFMGESLHYGDAERPIWPEVFPELAARKIRVESRLPYLTHAVTVDEADAQDLTARGLPSMWWPQAVPGRFIRTQVPPPGHRAIFGGTPYGKRQEILQHPALQGLLSRPASAEDQSLLPALFDGLQQATIGFMERGLKSWQRSLPAYLATLREIRQGAFELYLDALQAGCAVVNLPHLVKGYAGRVAEGMAAGRPVVSWDIPKRPMNRNLFEDGREILLFDADQPRQLADHLERIMRDPAFAARLADAARLKLQAFHTVEHRVAQILDWSTTGVEPRFA